MVFCCLGWRRMADALPVVVPREYQKGANKNYQDKECPVSETVKFSYGTAGFRSKADDLTFIAFRLGYLASLRARQLNKCIGVMITASHNPACDNGIKIVDPAGEMLASEWEKYATNLVNQSDEQFPTAVRALEQQVMMPINTSSARLVCAFDTRASGPHLCKVIKAGADLLAQSGRKVGVNCHGVLTTPQLHYIVKCENDPRFGVATADGYYEKLASAYNLLLGVTPSNRTTNLVLDCANGVGAKAMRRMVEYLKGDYLNVKFINEEGELNHECGADFVKIAQKLPANYQDVLPSTKCASFDGDADRLIYFRRADQHKDAIRILDGDKIAVLFTKYIKEQLDNAGLAGKLTLGIVQTAYANGASTKYIKDHLGVEPTCVPTGVKHLHHEACKYDIGLYFEANGHGTVVFSDKFKELVQKDSTDESIRRLHLISALINEVVGDAISDLLAVEMILRHYKWDIEDWDNKLYQDVPNVQIKVPVKERSLFKTNWAEDKLLEPADFQKKIDDAVKEANGIRSFVRPSGTENIVRVYAEAETEESTRALGEVIAALVREISA